VSRPALYAALSALLSLSLGCGLGETEAPSTPDPHAGHDHGDHADPHAGHDHGDEADPHAGHDHGGQADPHAGHDHGEQADPHAGHDHGDEADPHAGHDHGDEADPHAGHDHGDEADPHAGHDHGDEADPHAGHDHGSHGACVTLSSAAAENIGLTLHEVQPQVWYDQLKIPGILHVDWDRQATVSTPTTVRVVSLGAPPHATVRPGQRLAVLELVDPELRQLQIRAVETRASLVEARILRDRTRSYLEAIGSSAEVAEEQRRVEADLEILEAKAGSHASTLDTILAALEMAGLSEDQLEALEERGEPSTRISLYAPSLPGKPELEVMARDAHVGQTLEAGSPLFELAALDQLLVWGEAFEADVDTVRRAGAEDLPVSLLFPAQGLRVDDLSIRSMEGALDGEDRTTHFFVPLRNERLSDETVDGVRYLDWRHRAGARVQVLVGTDEVGTRMLIPAAALVYEGGSTLAYRKQDAHYEQVELSVSSVDSRQAVIPMGGGLEPGDLVVSAGALQVHLAYKQASGGAGVAADPHAGHNH
jgi:hypothetical protein